MKHLPRAAVAVLVMALAVTAGHCGEEGEGEGEEGGTEYAPDEILDETRGGAWMTLSYDGYVGAFVGRVENISEENLERVRVEVHLSDGTELGPTPAEALAPGEVMYVNLWAGSSTSFEWWSAHAEVGEDEHGGGGCEGDDEHEGGGHD